AAPSCPDGPRPPWCRPGSPGRPTKELSMGTVSRRGLFAATAALSAAGGTALGAGRADAAPPGAEPPPAPEFTEVSVHDPSVIVTDAGFHVFGSHLSAGRSEDLLHWEGVADLVSPENPLFED